MGSLREELENDAGKRDVCNTCLPCCHHNGWMASTSQTVCCEKIHVCKCCLKSTLQLRKNSRIWCKQQMVDISDVNHFLMCERCRKAWDQQPECPIQPCVSAHKSQGIPASGSFPVPLQQQHAPEMAHTHKSAQNPMTQTITAQCRVPPADPCDATEPSAMKVSKCDCRENPRHPEQKARFSMIIAWLNVT